MKGDKKTIIIYTWEQLERAKAGDMAAIGQFIEDNYRFLRGWAWNVLDKYSGVIPKNEYEPQDCINQVCVDFPYYDFDTIDSLVLCMFRSYIGVAHGGINGKHTYHKCNERTISLDTPIGISSRTGERENGSTLGDLLPSREPLPFDVVENKEHVKKIAPAIYRELANVFGVDIEHEEESGTASIGDILRQKQGKKTSFEQFQETIEEVFFGMTFEEVQNYAKIVAA